MKYINFLLIILISTFFIGCDTSQFQNHNDFNQVQNTQISLNEYANKNLTFYYRQVLSSTNTCINGTCPESNEIRTFLKVNNCDNICQNGAFKEDENKIDLNIASLNNNEMYPGCSNKDTFFFPDELEIIEETNDYIKAKGFGHGTNVKIGDNCNANYEYKYETDEIWIFTDKKLEDLTSVSYSLNEEKIIDSNKEIILDLESETKPYIDIICENSFDLNMKPWLQIVKINGKENKRYLDLKEDNIMYKDENNKARFYFSTSYDGLYEIQPYCTIYSGEQKQVNAKYTFNLTVINSKIGEFPN